METKQAIGIGKSRRIWASAISLLLIGVISSLYLSRLSRLNVILITLDTTRADRIGCYGYTNAETPALDGLAKKGVVFERAYAPVPVTLPSHASIFTGLYPPEHGLHFNGRGSLPTDIPVLAEILRKANYETAAFVASYVLDSKFGLDRGFQTYDDTPLGNELLQDGHHQFRSGQTIVDAALSWLAGRSSQPFFCWVHLYDAHAPYQDRPEIFGDMFRQQPYDAGIAFADLQLQRLVNFLETHRLDRRTLIVVVGDHGEGLMQHQEEEHGYQLYNTTLQVPLVIFDPRSKAAGHRVSTSVSIVDLMPTILECLEIRKPTRISGQSVKAALSGKSIESRSFYAESDVPFMYSRWAPLRSVVTDRWKYIKTTRSELYDLQTDPDEANDLSASEPERLHEFEEVLQQLHVNMTPRESTSIKLSGSERKALESLGYVSRHGASTQAPVAEQLPDIKEMMPLYNLICDSRRSLESGNAAQAIEIIRGVVDRAPNYLAAQVALGDALVRQKEYAEAAKIFAFVVDLHPDFPEAHASWADVLAKQGLYQQSASEYRRALELDPESAESHFYLANVLVNLGKIDDSISEMEQAIRRNPDYVEAHVQLGGLLAQRGRVKDAIASYETAIKLQPNVVIAYANLASLFAQQGQIDKAVAYASMGVVINPESFEARYTLGSLRLAQKDLRKALVEFTAACRLRPDEPTAQQQLLRVKAALAAPRRD